MLSPLSISQHITAFILMFSATVLLNGCSAEAESSAHVTKAQAVKLLTLADQNGTLQRVLPAEVDASDKSDLSFRIGGQLTELMVTEGQRVVSGQLIAQLDDRDLLNNLKAADASLRLAQVQYERIKRLYRAKQVSSSDYDTAQAQLDSAQATQQLAADQLSYAQLFAPFSGIIATRSVNNHQVVMANQGIMRIHSEAELEVIVEVPANQMIAMDNAAPFAQQRPTVRFSGSDVLYDITYKKHASKATLGTQTYKVTFALERPKQLNLLPGMTAEVVFQLSQQADTQLLPLTALGHSDETDQAIVWRYDRTNTALEAIPVEVINIQQDGVEVRSNLLPGDEVVAAGAAFLRADMAVVPLKWERGV